MKKTEKIEILSSYGDARELFTISEEFSRVKYLMKSISERKGIHTEEVEKIITSFRKVRIGSVVNTFIKVKQMSQGVAVPETHKNLINGLWRRAERYVTEVVALADRLMTACLGIVSTLSSERVGDKKREENIERALNAVESIISKTTREEMISNFTALIHQYNGLKQNAPESTETPSDEVLSTDNEVVTAKEENAVEANSELSVESDDILPHVDIIDSVCTPIIKQAV